MKLHVSSKKLILKKSTVSSLDAVNLENVKGGILTWPRTVCQGTVNATICFTDCGGQDCLSHPPA